MDSLDTYLGVLYDGLTGYVYSPVKTVDSWESHWFEWPAQQEQLREHILNKFGDVYISPAVYSERRAVKDAIKKLQTVWVEFDGQDRIDFQSVPHPTAIVQTSYDSHVHCYWKIDPANQGVVEDVNRRLTSYLKADSSGWDATQLLRPPQTTNWKHNLPVVLADYQPDVHGLAEFDFVPEIKAPAVEITEISDLLPLNKILNKHNLAVKLMKMIKTESPKEPHRSSFMFRLANELAEEELNHLEIVSVLKHVDDRVGKYKDRTDQLRRLSQIADLAVLRTEGEEQVAQYTWEYILNHVEDLHWLMPGWLHEHGFLMLGGAPNVGKTQFCCQMAYCLAMGERFLGMLAPRKLKVMLWSLEMDIRSLKFILTKQKDEWKGIPEIITIDEETTWNHYEDMIDQNNVDVVIIDSLSEITGQSTQDEIAETKRVMRWIKKIRRRYNVAVVLIHHTRKPGEGNKRPKNLADFIGSQDIARVVETGLMLWEDSRGLELSVVKGRFTSKGVYSMLSKNTKSFWFSRRDNNDIGEDDRSDSADSQRTERQQTAGSGLRDKQDGKPKGSVSFRFGD